LSLPEQKNKHQFAFVLLTPLNLNYED
jgi:hypothetical protein